MSGFNAAWLDLREPADHRSRSAKVARRLSQHFDGWQPITVVDIGCGTGSNLRGTAPLLGPEQHWTLVDHDEGLLAAAAERLSAWADAADRRGERLELFKGAKRISVDFRRADLAGHLETALGPSTNLVTASAFFDLVSPAFVASFVTAVTRRKAVFYTVLTYDGDQRWLPEHEADAAMAEAFHTHQSSNKGFGAAAGPAASDLLSDAFHAAGYSVFESDSAWRLGPDDEALIAELAAGFAGAVRETGSVPTAIVDEWLKVTRVGAVVGHTDLFAVPATI